MGSPDNLTQEYKHLSNKKKEMVYHIALKYLEYEKDAAEDIAQEVLLKWYQYIKSGNEIKNLDAWLAIVTKNTALTHKMYRDMEENSLDRDLCVDDIVCEKQLSVEDEYIEDLHNKELNARSKKVLDALYEKNERWYEAVVMAYFMDMRYKDIANHFGVSRAAIDMIISRAIKWCRKNCDLSER